MPKFVTSAAALGAVAALALTLASLHAVGAAGQTYVAYGADTTPAERQELATVFGVDPSAQAQTVTTPEMVAALQNTGLQVAETDKSVSSSGLTCLNKGDGLTVKTQNITRITAPVYANALVTAGVGDANVIIAAPTDNPVTGETALVGVLKSAPECQNGAQIDPNRARYAYEEVAYTVALAGPNGDLNKASTVMLKAAQPVISRQATDAASIGTALDQAAQSEGIAVDPSQRPALVTFLTALGGLDYGTYAKGYQIQQSSPTQVKVIPAGAGSPNGAAASNQAGGSPAPGGSAATVGPAATAANAAAIAASPVAAAATATTAASPVAAAAAATSTGTAAPGANAAVLASYSGTVTSTGSSLAVKQDSGVMQQAVPAAGVVVTRNGKSATLSDIKTNDKVNVTNNAAGSATRIDATSKSGTDLGFLKWLIPLIIVLLLLLLLLLWLLSRRRKDSFILEQDAGTGGGPGSPPRR